MIWMNMLDLNGVMVVFHTSSCVCRLPVKYCSASNLQDRRRLGGRGSLGCPTFCAQGKTTALYHCSKSVLDCSYSNNTSRKCLF